ncbi:pseudouridine synthase, RluA family [Capnocytophaga sp. oral taxon 863 str. F0517]|uniref:RluA family pseudouridine synthase n=1 Tax=Capnocytophaga sp. oral taxon 863 TaxID=1227265 RepID=UPI0003978B9E|nr:RNA pseudouridine synthase [Capnocytophaga sp. oral taxon 863]ERI63038.1 pseudouridine synthase, RluA family [Capnocytophaga sp. oral taxon 863 str. F0517]
MKTNAQNLEVLYEDNHLIAVNKRAGDIVQGDKTGDIPLSEIVKAYLVEKYHKPGEAYLGVVHRLDRPTTGLVLFAKTSKALPRLNAAFATKQEVSKQYWALVEKKEIPQEATLTHFLVRNTTQNKSYAYPSERPQSQKAILKYKTLASLDHYLLVEITLLTGRHHQIRAQFAALGCPIKGDLKYGAKRSNPDGSICLHARVLELLHPVKKEPLSLIAPLPENFAKLVEAIPQRSHL